MAATLEKPPNKPSPAKPPMKLPARGSLPRKPHVQTYEEVVARVLADDAPEQAPKPSPNPKPAAKRAGWAAADVLLRGTLGLALFAAGVLFIGWTSHRVDLQMRDEILLQAQLVAQAINARSLHTLSGTGADLQSPPYQRLKEQLMLIRKANAKCRFIYLMGRRPDGTIFFFADSEDPASPDYSPPGELFYEATDDDRRVFTSGVGNAKGGPYEDRWGVWISAMAPVFHPDDGDLLGVLGMDFDATNWKMDVATKSAMPALPAALAFFFGASFLIAAFRAAWR